MRIHYFITLEKSEVSLQIITFHVILYIDVNKKTNLNGIALGYCDIDRPAIYIRCALEADHYASTKASSMQETGKHTIKGVAVGVLQFKIGKLLLINGMARSAARLSSSRGS